MPFDSINKRGSLATVSQTQFGRRTTHMAETLGKGYAVCPIFETMFSDAPHLPKFQIVRRQSRFVTSTAAAEARSEIPANAVADLQGVDRYKFFHKPLAPKSEAKLQLTLDFLEVPRERKLANKKIQTMYRESSAQTSPWQPPYKVVDGSDPEILKLDFLKWGCGLPAGVHEVSLIERMRMKHQWEKTLPPITDGRSLARRRELLEALERDAWLQREQEIQDIQDLRYQLLEQMLKELFENTKIRTEKKMQMFCMQKLASKEEKLRKLRRDCEREKRRLDFNHRGIIMKYHPVNVIDEHADYKSELYAPMMRHGSHPKRWHQVIDEHMKKYKAKFIGVENYETAPNWLEHATKIPDRSIKLPGTRLCIRETKWTKPVLQALHEELKCLRKVSKKCNIRMLIERKLTPPPTPEIDEVDEHEEIAEQGCIQIQSTIRGRAAQILVFEGRDTCRELIQELRSTHAVLNKQAYELYKQKLEVQYDQRDEAICIENTKKVQEALNRLQGGVVGTLLDFLNKELRRLLDERKAHALGMMAERERQKREAAEAGRRQAELRRRREHDEMFRQVVKYHQETVDIYLEDIINEGMDEATTKETKEYIIELATKLDIEIYKTRFRTEDFGQQEDYIAELVHHFLLPEVSKALVRERIKKRENRQLKIVHNELFGAIETLPKPHVTPEQLERELRRKKRKERAERAQKLKESEVEVSLNRAQKMKESEEEVSFSKDELVSLKKRDEMTSWNKISPSISQTAFEVTSFLDFI